MAVAGAGDVERQADQREMQVDPAAYAAVGQVLIRQFFPGRVDRAGIHKGLHAQLYFKRGQAQGLRSRG